MKQLGVFLLLLGWDDSSSQGYPQALNLDTWLERGTVKLSVLSKNTVFPAVAQTNTDRSIHIPLSYSIIERMEF